MPSGQHKQAVNLRVSEQVVDNTGMFFPSPPTLGTSGGAEQAVQCSLYFFMAGG